MGGGGGEGVGKRGITNIPAIFSFQFLLFFRFFFFFFFFFFF